MRTFKSIGKGKCLICGTSKAGECFLAPQDGTSDGNIEEAQPIHLECVTGLRYNKELNMLYYKMEGK